MTNIPSLVLYSHINCWWAHRGRLALDEVGATWKKIPIDLQNRPEWYPEVNPSGKVPVLQLGEDRSTSVKIPESWIIVEFVADLFPERGLFPSDPLKRAEMRYAVTRVTQLMYDPFMDLVKVPTDEKVEKYLENLKEVQSLLTRHPGKFFDGNEFTAADIGISPFIVWQLALGAHGFTPVDKIYEKVSTDLEFKILWEYSNAAKQRESFRKNWDEKHWVTRIAAVFNRTLSVEPRN